MNNIEAMKQALEALEDINSLLTKMTGATFTKLEAATTSLRQALSEAQLSVNENSHAIEQASSVSSIQSDKTSDAEKQEPVAIYQYQLASGSWIDQTKESHDYNVRHGQAIVRVVYTTPQPQEFVCSTGLCHYTQPQRELNCVCGAVWEGDEMVCVPHKREWVGLTDAEIEEFDYYARDLVMDIEKALKERNNVA